MIKISNKKLNIIHEKPLEGDVKTSLANTQKSEKLLKWKYSIELKEGLKELIKNSKM